MNDPARFPFTRARFAVPWRWVEVCRPIAFAVGILHVLAGAEARPRVAIGYRSRIMESLPPQWGGTYLHAEFQAPPGWIVDADAFPGEPNLHAAGSDSVFVLLGVRAGSDSLAFGPWSATHFCPELRVPGGPMQPCKALEARAYFRTGVDDFSMLGRSGADSSAYPRAWVRLAYMSCGPPGCGAARTVVAEAYGSRPDTSWIEEATEEDLRSTPPIRQAVADFARIGNSISGDRRDSLLLSLSVRMNPGWRIVADPGGDTALLPMTVGARAVGFGFRALPVRGKSRIPAPTGQGEIEVLDSVFQIEFVSDVPRGESENPGRSPQSGYPDTQVWFRYQACNGPVCLPRKEATYHYLKGLPGVPYFVPEAPFRPISIQGVPRMRRGTGRGMVGRGAMRRGEVLP